MDALDSKFEFPGLYCLKDVGQLVFSPLGQNSKGRKFYQLKDSADTYETVLICECSHEEEDILVRDKYGVIRFSICGAHFNDQLDIYINAENPIGIIKQNVVYDSVKDPVYTIVSNNHKLFFGKTTHLFQSCSAKHIDGCVKPLDGQMLIEFGYTLPFDIKAMVIAYAIQLAFTKYKMWVTKSAHPYGEINYMPPKRSSRLAEGLLKTDETAASYKSTKQATHQFIIPRTYRKLSFFDTVTDCNLVICGRDRQSLEYYELTDRNGQIFLTIELNRYSDRAVAKDNYGGPRFTLVGNLLSIGHSEFISSDNVLLGKIEPYMVLMEDSKIAYELVPYRINWWGYTSFIVMRSFPKIQVGVIRIEKGLYSLAVNIELDVISKAQIIACFFKLLVVVWQIRRQPASNRLVKYNYLKTEEPPASVSLESQVDVCGIRPNVQQRDEKLEAQTMNQTVIEEMQEVRLRGAGYNMDGVTFYEIISTAEGRILLTIECRLAKGEALIKENHGIILFHLQGMTVEYQEIVVLGAFQTLIGKIADGQILGDNEELLIDPIQQETEHKFGLKSYNMMMTEHNECGSVIPETSTICIKMNKDLESNNKILILCFALKAALSAYGISNLPVPLVNYGYLSESCIDMQHVTTPEYRRIAAPQAAKDGTAKRAETHVQQISAYKRHTGSGIHISAEKVEENIHVQVFVDGSPNAQVKSRIVTIGKQLSVVRGRTDNEFETPVAYFKSQPSPKPAPFPSLALMRNIINISIKPIGMDKKGIRYYKIFDLNMSKSFLTCECHSPSEDLKMKDRHGNELFYIRGAWQEDDLLHAYINPTTVIGGVQQNKIYDHIGSPLCQFYKPMFSNTPYKIVKINDGKTIAKINKESSNNVTINIDVSANVQIKALLLTLAMQLSFTKYGMAYVPMPKIKYQYIQRKSKMSKDPQKSKTEESVLTEKQDSRKNKSPPKDVADNPQTNTSSSETGIAAKKDSRLYVNPKELYDYEYGPGLSKDADRDMQQSSDLQQPVNRRESHEDNTYPNDPHESSDVKPVENTSEKETPKEEENDSKKIKRQSSAKASLKSPLKKISSDICKKEITTPVKKSSMRQSRGKSLVDKSSNENIEQGRHRSSSKRSGASNSLDNWRSTQYKLDWWEEEVRQSAYKRIAAAEISKLKSVVDKKPAPYIP